LRGGVWTVPSDQTLYFQEKIGFVAQKSMFALGRWTIGFWLMVVIDIALDSRFGACDRLWGRQTPVLIMKRSVPSLPGRLAHKRA